MQKPRWTYPEYVELSHPGPLRKLYRKTLNICARFCLLPKIRITLYRMMGMHIGNNVFIGPDCYLDDTFPELLTIEDEAVISFRVTIAVHGESAGRLTSKVSPVVIRKRGFIGTGAILLPGIEIGESAVVGAGAIVTKDVLPNTTVVGNPAKAL